MWRGYLYNSQLFNDSLKALLSIEFFFGDIISEIFQMQDRSAPQTQRQNWTSEIADLYRKN